MSTATATAPGRILLCTDLDRTLIPNGAQPESALARTLFQRLAERAEITLVYVSGRNAELVRDALSRYSLPRPGYVIADVGTRIYGIDSDHWRELTEWQTLTMLDWQGLGWRDINHQVGAIPELELQDEQHQHNTKLSYQISPATGLESALLELQTRLADSGIEASCVASIDETRDLGLLDVLPRSANKRLAIDFLRNRLALDEKSVFFSGDSGNDLDVVVSPYQSVLVANATAGVKREAEQRCRADGQLESLYIASGLSYPELNGNYAGGIIEGFLHFFPHYRDLL